MDENRMLELADLLAELKENKAAAEAQLSAINEDIASVEEELIGIMTEQECAGFKRGGNSFSLVITEYPSPIPENKGELWEAMKKQGFEHLFTINSRTLQGTVKELMANNDGVLPEWLDGLMHVAEKATIRVRKSR